MPSTVPASASSAPIGLRQKSELAVSFSSACEGCATPARAVGAIADVESYGRLLMAHTGRPLKGARVLEVGYSAPSRRNHGPFCFPSAGAALPTCPSLFSNRFRRSR